MYLRLWADALSGGLTIEEAIKKIKKNHLLSAELSK